MVAVIIVGELIGRKNNRLDIFFAVNALNSVLKCLIDRSPSGAACRDYIGGTHRAVRPAQHTGGLIVILIVNPADILKIDLSAVPQLDPSIGIIGRRRIVGGFQEEKHCAGFYLICCCYRNDILRKKVARTRRYSGGAFADAGHNAICVYGQDIVCTGLPGDICISLGRGQLCGELNGIIHFYRFFAGDGNSRGVYDFLDYYSKFLRIDRMNASALVRIPCVTTAICMRNGSRTRANASHNIAADRCHAVIIGGPGFRVPLTGRIIILPAITVACRSSQRDGISSGYLVSASHCGGPGIYCYTIIQRKGGDLSFFSVLCGCFFLGGLHSLSGLVRGLLGADRLRLLGCRLCFFLRLFHRLRFCAHLCLGFLSRELCCGLLLHRGFSLHCGLPFYSRLCHSRLCHSFRLNFYSRRFLGIRSLHFSCQRFLRHL